MAGLMNKRAIARNERTLQDLLKQSGNDRCADCFTRNPGWASWNLGIFLCVRCASLHRKLGTHISKVKSLSMDAWTQEQVESMKRTGNIASNRHFNPRGQNPNIPIDADEIDSAMERFIREKYQYKTLSGEGRPLPSIKHHTGNSDSSNDIPPPLPPKNGPRMAPAMRSQSSTYPSQSALPSPPASDRGSSSSRVGAAQRMGGISERELETRNDFALKLDRLREMGFANSTRNTTILKGCAGDLDKAANTLTRLGEGYGNVLPKPRQSSRQTNGISVESPTTPPPKPFSPQTTGPPSHQSNPNAELATNNPFLRNQAISTQSRLDQPMQSLTLNSQQPPNQLFPHKTGTWPAQHAQANSNPFLNSSAPPYSSSPHPVYNGVSYPAGAPNQPNLNLRSTRSQTLPPSNPFGHQNPFLNAAGTVIHGQSQQPVQSPAHIDQFFPTQQYFPQSLMQQQQQQYAQPSQHMPQQSLYAEGLTTTQQSLLFSGQLQGYANGWTGSHASTAQQSAYRDKTSIMALYNNVGNSHQQTVPQNQGLAQAPAPPFQDQQYQQQQQQQPQRSVTMPVGSSGTNPFATNATPLAQGHISRESMLFTGQALPGRAASPDAFSGLSARH